MNDMKRAIWQRQVDGTLLKRTSKPEIFCKISGNRIGATRYGLVDADGTWLTWSYTGSENTAKRKMKDAGY